MPDKPNLISSNSAVALFQAINSVTGEGCNSFLTGTFAETGSSSYSAYKFCAESSSLSESLEIDQSASVGIGLFGASEKSSFLSSTQQSAFSLNLIVHGVAKTKVQTALSWEANKGIAIPRTPKELATFCKEHGDSFISSITLGAEYIALITIYANSLEEKRSTEAQVTASGLASGVSLGGDVQTKLNKLTSETSLRIDFKQYTDGLSGVTVPTSMSGIVEFAQKISELGSKLTLPSVVAAETRGYEALSGFPDMEPIASNRKYFLSLTEPKGVFRESAAVKNLIDRIEEITGIHDAYGHEDTALQELKDLAQADLNAINAQRDTFLTNTESVFVKPGLPSLTRPFPKLRYRVDYSEAWGGSGGNGFDDVTDDPDNFITSRKTIHRIEMRTDWYVRGLIIHYRSYNSQGSVQDQKTVHGQEINHDETPLELGGGERITAIDGHSGGMVDELIVTTNLGRKARGGRHATDVSPFSFAIPKDAVLLGFKGQSGEYLDRIQAVYATFQPSVAEN